LRYYAGVLDDNQGYEKRAGKLSPNEDTRSVPALRRPASSLPFNSRPLAAGMPAARCPAATPSSLPAEATLWCGRVCTGVHRGRAAPGCSSWSTVGSRLRALISHPAHGVAFTGSADG
jgi:hypothetical protein